MLVLALDTTTRTGSVALARESRVIAAFAGDAAITHGERLPGDLMRVLETHGLRVGDVDLFAVAAGPGSFTGLRIGIATMQGLALANGKPLSGISALDAIKEAVSPELSALSAVSEVAVWMDARRGQVFSAVYRDDLVFEPALVEKPGEILARWARDGVRPSVFAGDGAIAYQDLIRAADPAVRIVEPLPILAPSVALLAEAHVRQHGPSSPDAIRAIYIRQSDAEITRDRKADLKVSTTAAGSTTATRSTKATRSSADL
jgi:tRNA threonylcarbamoyladenosine biosynthesis protein TsaB